MAKETTDKVIDLGAATPAQIESFVEQLRSELKELTEKHALQKKRGDKLEATLKGQQEIAGNRPELPSHGIVVVIDGQIHPSIGDFRADNTFAEVKRGHCPEGVTLIAIDKKH